MGRPKKYTEKTLTKAVRRYFDSISREVAVTERVDSGERDSKGHVIWNTVPVTNKLGEPMKVTEYAVPPTVAGLCAYLGIHRSTWAEYCDPDRHAELIAVTAEVRDIMQGYREEQLLTRSGKDVRGIVFDLQNNYGYSEKRSVEVTGGVEDYLKQLAEQGQVPGF